MGIPTLAQKVALFLHPGVSTSSVWGPLWRVEGPHKWGGEKTGYGEDNSGGFKQKWAANKRLLGVQPTRGV